MPWVCLRLPACAGHVPPLGFVPARGGPARSCSERRGRPLPPWHRDGSRWHGRLHAGGTAGTTRPPQCQPRSHTLLLLPPSCVNKSRNEDLSHPPAQKHPNMVTGQATTPARQDQSSAGVQARKRLSRDAVPLQPWGFAGPRTGGMQPPSRGTSRKSHSVAQRGCPEALLHRPAAMCPAGHRPGRRVAPSCQPCCARTAPGTRLASALRHGRRFKVCSLSREGYNREDGYYRHGKHPRRPALGKKISPILQDFLPQQHSPAGSGRLLGVSRHVDLELQSLEGQSKGGVGPEWDPALPAKNTGHNTSQLPAQRSSPPAFLYAGQASSVGSFRPKKWGIPKRNKVSRSTVPVSRFTASVKNNQS